MITYRSGAFGLQVLLRFHGSAAYKALTPALISSAFYLGFFYITDLSAQENVFDHPYPMTALIVAFTFLLTFKANFSYNRYWEAVTAVHQMHSKWLDVGMELCAFHLQSDLYKKKPPAFGQHPEYDGAGSTKHRRYEPPSPELLEEQIEKNIEPAEMSIHSRFAQLASRSKWNIADPSDDHGHQRPRMLPKRGSSLKKDINGSLFKDRLPTPLNPVDPQTKHPSPFLQEAAHLLSLLSAVAMSTLRNDVEAAESPLATFRRGAPWPAVDPDALDADVRDDWGTRTTKCSIVIRFLLGLTRTDRDRTLYNAARPFRVIGGVSDGEVELLQAARGPFAKVALVSVWLQEFMSREYLQGSTGEVGPPIISRLYQFTSDGMLGYNQARKIAYIPFPFPHSQITSLFMLIVIIYIPVLMLSFVKNAGWGYVLNFLTVMCFAGLHEVARELESPFQNVPNDIPLNYFQAQFNEALMNMFVGYHPDAYWLPTRDDGETQFSSTYPPDVDRDDSVPPDSLVLTEEDLEGEEEELHDQEATITVDPTTIEVLVKDDEEADDSMMMKNDSPQSP